MPSTQSESKARSCVALIPAFDEGPFIAEVVRGVLRQALECVVVDDGSRDDTGGRAEAAGARVLRHAHNMGKGAAIKTALTWFIGESDASHAILLDGDGQHDPSEISRFIEAAARSGARLLVGNRMTDTRRMPPVRRFVNWYMSWEISRVCGQNIPDSQCGYRMVHRALAPKLLAATNSFDYETEMLFVASHLGEPIVAVPVSTIYGSETSKIRPLRDAVAFFQLLARYRLRRRGARRRSQPRNIRNP